MRICKEVFIDRIINSMIFFYILSLYLFTYKEGLNIISNALAALLVVTIWVKCLLAKGKLVFNQFLFVYFLFIVLCLVSFFVAIDKDIVLSKVITLTLIFIVMLSLVNYIDNLGKLKKFLIAFVYSGFIASLYILTASDFSASNFLNVIRFGGELGNHNTVGIILGISATFCFYLFWEAKKYRYWYLLLLLVIVPSILFTGSRQSLLFIMMNFIIILYLRNRKSLKNKLKLFLGGGLLLLIFLFLVFKIPLLYHTIGYKIENTHSFLSGNKAVNERSLSERSFMIKVGLEMFKEHPFLGYGIDNYRFYFKQVPGGSEAYSHNNFIELIVGTGIFGFLLYYLTHLIVLKKLCKVSKFTKEKTICYTFISIIISHIALSMVFVYYYEKHFSLLLSIGSIIGRVIHNDLNLEQKEKRLLC